MIFKSVDKKLEELGFVKLTGEDRENKYGVCYVRKNHKYNYTQRLDISHKSNGDHIIQSYEEGANKDGFSNVVGLTYLETKLAMKKYRQMKRKYKWN